MKTAILALLLMVATTLVIVTQPFPARGLIDPHPVVDPLVTNPADRAANIEVVFVLDTTGSMSGLIDTAKQKIWSIASSMASAQNAPEVKVGLVAYRDRGDAYVTQVTDLSHDLDSVYGKLMDFRAEGGGDTPESGNTALRVAVDEISWGSGDNVTGQTYRVIFLVGDAPMHLDYPDEEDLSSVIRRAQARGIIVNTIRAGNSPQTQSQWQWIAGLAQGAYTTIDQHAQAVAIATPYDTKLAEVSAALDHTRLPYGNREDRATAAAKAGATRKLHDQASAATRARRAAFNAKAGGKKNLYGKDLVNAISTGEVKLDEVAEDELPATLRSMNKEEQQQYIAGVAEKRQELEKQITSLTRARADYIASQTESMDNLEESFEYKIYETIKSQTADVGLEYAAPAPEL